MRLHPAAVLGGPPAVQSPGTVTAASLAALWRFVITAADGAELLVLREENGMLVAEGDESRWTEAAKRFVGMVLQWTGQSPVPWKDEARGALEGR